MLTLPEHFGKLRVSMQQEDIKLEDLAARRLVAGMGKKWPKEFAASKAPRIVLEKMDGDVAVRESIESALEEAPDAEALMRRIVLYSRVKVSQLEAQDRLFYKALGWKRGESGEKYLLKSIRAREHGVNFFKFPEIIAGAARANNRGFFIRLGRALSEKPVKAYDVRRLDKVEVFLADGWFWNGHGVPDLCHFTDEGLLDLLETAFPEEYEAGKLTLDKVRKMRQRLRLKKADGPFVKEVIVKGSEIQFALERRRLR